MAQELARNGQDIALSALVGAAVTAKNTWIVPCTSDPAGGGDRSVTAAEVHTARFQGAPAVSTAASDWGTPTGTAARTRALVNAKQTAAATGLGAPIDVTHFALVQTTDDLVPDAGDTFSNISNVVAYDTLASTKSGVDNGDIISFGAGSITVTVD